MSKKSLFIRFFLIICISVLLAGCTININVGNPSNASENETTPNHNSDTSTNISIYQSRATIYISNKGSAESPAISSSDLIVSKDFIESYIVILNSKQIQSKIREKYPSAEYTLTLEPMNETNVFSIIAANASNILDQILFRYINQCNYAFAANTVLMQTIVAYILFLRAGKTR